MTYPRQIPTPAGLAWLQGWASETLAIVRLPVDKARAAGLTTWTPNAKYSGLYLVEVMK